MAIITISRGTRSGGQALAELCAERLQYPVLGREVIQEAAAQLGVSEEALSRRMEDAPRLWDWHSSTRRLYVTAVQAALAEHVLGGNLVYHGLAGQLLLRGLPAVLRVRLIAPLEMRIHRLMEAHEMDEGAAEHFIADVDEARVRWVRMMYGENIHDPALYDMVINLEAVPLPAACAVVSATVRKPEFAVTEEVHGRLGEFQRTCRVKIALATAAETRGLELDVDTHGGSVEVSGSVPLLSKGPIEDQITRIARAVPGVEEVRLKIQWFDPYP